MSSLEEKLALGKKVSNMERNASTYNRSNNFLTGNVDSINEMVYGNNYILEEGQTAPYDAKEDMKRIQKGLPEDILNCKLPKPILESIKDNPLNGLSSDPKLDAFTERLSKVMPDGIKNFNAIQEKLDESDNKSNNTQSYSNQPNIDYELIKTLVENAVKKELSKLNSTLLNESYSNNNNDLKVLKMNMDKFLFLDSDDNVYECKLVYKGKNRKRKK